MSEGPVYFLLHVPKCAGTTVEGHFASHLGPGFLLAPRWESVARNFVGNRYPFGPGDARLARVRAVSGHSLSANLAKHFPGREVRECVLLRAPEGFFLSFWNYRMSRHRENGERPPPDFPLWYAAQRRNPITRFLMNRYFGFGVPALYRFSTAGRFAWLEERLSRFWFVGGVRHASAMIAGISRELGVPEKTRDRNVGRNKALSAEDLDPALRERIAHENAADQALFDRWGERLWRGGPEPDAPPPALPQFDQPAQVMRDSLGGILKKLQR